MTLGNKREPFLGIKNLGGAATKNRGKKGATEQPSYGEMRNLNNLPTGSLQLNLKVQDWNHNVDGML